MGIRLTQEDLDMIFPPTDPWAVYVPEAAFDSWRDETNDPYGMSNEQVAVFLANPEKYKDGSKPTERHIEEFFRDQADTCRRRSQMKGLPTPLPPRGDVSDETVEDLIAASLTIAEEKIEFQKQCHHRSIWHQVVENAMEEHQARVRQIRLWAFQKRTGLPF